MTYKSHKGGLLTLIHNQSHVISQNFPPCKHITISPNNANNKSTTPSMFYDKHVYAITHGKTYHSTILIKQCKLLIMCPITMRHAINKFVTIIKVDIAHSFYVVPFSVLAIKKLNNDSNCHTQSRLLISQNVCQNQLYNYHVTCLGEKFSY